MARDLFKEAGIDMQPRDLFQEAGIKFKKKGLRGIGEDIQESISGVPDAIENMLSELPGQLEGIADHPLRGLANIGAGLGEGVIGAVNAPYNIAQYLKRKDIPYFKQMADYAPHIPDLGIEKKLFGEDKPGDALVRSLSAFAIPGKIGKFGEAGLPTRAAIEGIHSAGQNQDPLQGILTSETGGLAAKGIGKGLGALRPSKSLRGNLSPEELQRSLDVTEGTDTSLGDVIKSPTLKRLYENVLPHVIGSGTYKKMQKNATKIQEKGSDLISKFQGNFRSDNYGEKIQEALRTSSKDVTDVKNAKFKKTNDLADETNTTTDRSNLRRTADAILNQIEEDPDLSSLMNASDKRLIKQLASNPSESKVPSRKSRSFDTTKDEPIIGGDISVATGKPIDTKTLNVSQKASVPISNPKNLVSVITGKPIEQNNGYSIKSTDILRGKIGKKAYEASYKGETDRAALLGMLKKALENDVQESIDKSGSSKLKNAHRDAMDFYKGEYTLYKDPDIHKFIKQGGDPDLILSHFIKGGKNDRATLLQKISKGVRQQPNGTDNILASSYLSRAIDRDGNLDPVKLRTLYHDLGKNQQKALFGDNKVHKSLKDFVDLVDKNTESFKTMLNLGNGQRNLDLISKMTQVGASASTGHGLVGFAAPLVAAAAGGKGLTHLLTSSKVREKLVRKMIANEGKSSGKKTKLAEKLSRRVLAADSGQEHKPLELLLTK
jgi:hypothetical protein